MTWRIEPTGKNCIHERREFSGDHEVAITIYWRSGYIVVDELPDLTDYDPGEGIEISSFDDWQFRDGSTELEIGEETPDDERAKIEEAFSEDGEDGLEALGYTIWDTTYKFSSDLKVVDLRPEIIESIKESIAGLEDMDSLAQVARRIYFQGGLAEETKTDLMRQLFTAGLDLLDPDFLAITYCEHANEFGAPKELIRQAITTVTANLEEARDLAFYGGLLIEYEVDADLAGELLDRAVANVRESYEVPDLMEEMFKHFPDSSYLSDLPENHTELLDGYDSRKIAEVIAVHGQDTERARYWYEHAIELAHNWFAQYALIGSIRLHLDDEDLATKAHEAFDYLSNIGLELDWDYSDYDDAVYWVLMDPDGEACSDEEGVCLTSETPFAEHEYLGYEATIKYFLLPGQYEGPIETNAKAIDIIGLGSPDDIVISSDTGHTIVAQTGIVRLKSVTVERVEGEDSESSASVIVMGDCQVLIEGCILKNTLGFACAAFGDGKPLLDIIDCQVADSANGILVATGRTRIDGVTYSNVEGFEAKTNDPGILEYVEARHRDAESLVHLGLLFNLYDFNEEWVDPDDFDRYWSDETADAFRRTYFACALSPQMPDELREFFATHLPSDFEQRMSP
jgi:hypothetical protein